MNRLCKLSVAGAILLIGVSCCRELVPPAIDLKTYEVVGIVKFNTNAQGTLGNYATQKFIEWLRRDQIGIRIIELGTEADVLAAVGKTRIDPDAVKAIAKKYNVKTLFTGELSISNVRPRVAITPGFKWVSVAGDVDATLTASMIETETGASVWTGSGRAEREVGNIGFIDGKFSFNAQDPDATYGDLIRELVKKTTRDFRNSWRCK